jgi:DNA-binding NarL/FixJ family response regulator
MCSSCGWSSDDSERPAGQPVRVFAVSPHEVIRDGVTSLLSGYPRRVTVVGTSGRVVRVNVDVVVFDLAALTSGGAASDLLHLARSVPVLGFGGERLDSPEDSAQVFGVRLVVPSRVSGPELVSALEEATATASDRRRSHDRTLGEGELAVLRLVGAGLSNQEIADELVLSINTVKSYLRGAYRKIGVQRRAEAVLWCVQHGMT